MIDEAIADSSVIYTLNGQYESGYIFAKDTGSTYTDSIRVSAGQVRYAEDRITAIDTLWRTLIVKDSSNTVQTVINCPNQTSGWWIFDFMSIQLLKLELLNIYVKATGTVNRTWQFSITLRKRSIE